MVKSLRHLFVVSLLTALLVAAPAGFAATSGTLAGAGDDDRSVNIDSTADHSQFEALQGPFESGMEVTEACLSCHTEAAQQVHESIHWTWEYTQPETEQKLGKRHALNNFCLGIAGSYERCASCHVGYGWEDKEFDFSAEERVDCLVCHDTTGDYIKFPTAAGHPPYEDTEFRGTLFKAPDLAHVSQNVGKTSRETCGSCHFEGGGGDAVKHGDLDSSLIDPSRSLDVHMASDGLDFSCATCHEFAGHIQKGSRYHVTVADEREVSVPGRESQRPSCESCHGAEPHEPGLHDKLNQHSEIIACQTCHVPEMARGGKATKTLWDWSTAGRLDDDGNPIVEKENGLVTYDGMKGHFEWKEDYPPEYRWFDGNMRYTLIDDTIDPSQTVPVNQPEGEPGDGRSRIWPFKTVDGKSPYDAQRKTLLVPKLFGQDDDHAFWGNYDWDRALAAGMEEARAAGQTEGRYSGEHGFVATRMYWPVAHMVAPAEESLACADCHSSDGRMAGVEGVYVPGDDGHPWTERIGWFAVAATLLGVVGHAGARIVVAAIRRRRQTAEEEGEKA